MKKLALSFLLVSLSIAGFSQAPDPGFIDKIGHLESSDFLKKLNFKEHSHSGETDFIYQRMEWEIDPSVKYIRGKVTTYFKAEKQEVTSVFFDLHDSLTVDSVRHRLAIPVYHHSGNLLSIRLPNTLNKGEIDSLSIYYQGEPHDSGFGSFVQSQHNGIPVLWTLSEPYGAMEWWPCKQSLTDKTDATDIIVTTPKPYRTASNGILLSEKVIGDRRAMHWRHRYPIAAYLVAIAVTNYTDYTDYAEISNGTEFPVVHFVYPEDLDKIRPNTAVTLEAMRLFNSLFGDYPFSNEKYGHAQFGWGGGMEHQTMSFMGSFGFELIVHELAHQWFGNYVTLGSWQDIWLNEGFASYATGLAYEHLLDGYWWPRWKRLNVERIVSQPGGSVFVDDTTSVSRIFNGRLSYSKGAYLLHMLRWMLGDEKFFQAVRNYLSDPGVSYGFASHKKVEAHFEAVAGRSLRNFFDQWYYGEGFPVYSLWFNAGGKDSPFQVKLTQQTSHSSVPFFEIPVPIRVYGYGTGDSIDFRIEPEDQGKTLELNVPFQVMKVAIDPDYWLIRKTDGVTGVMAPGKGQPLMVYPNPFNKQITLNPPRGEEIKMVRIFDQQGRLVYSRIPDKNEIHPELDPGLYIMKIWISDQIMETKLIRL
jgi:aminopeptidase N